MKDERSLLEIALRRFVDNFGSGTSVESEDAFIEACKTNLISIFRAFLLSVAITYFAIHARQPFIDTLASQRPWIDARTEESFIWLPLTLLLAAVFTPRLIQLFILIWRFARRHFPSFIFFSVAGFCLLSDDPCPSVWRAPGLLSVVSLMISYCLIFWVSSKPLEPMKDELRRDYFVDRLHELFQNKETSLRRTAILGTWGLGKTTVLHLLRQKLEASKECKFRVALVNPWTAKTIEEACTILASGFDQALGKTYLANEWPMHRWLAWINGIKAGPQFLSGMEISVDFRTLLLGSASDAERKLLQKINRELEHLKHTCVIMVDDMERAEPEVIRKLFPIIDLIGKIHPCFFVFAIDPDRVAKAFQEKGHGDTETKGYLDKVFDLKLDLPDPRRKDIIKMGRKFIIKSECPKLVNHFSELEAFLPTNPRDFKRFIDDAKTKEFMFLDRFEEEEKNFRNFFLLRLLELELPGVFDDLQTPEALEYSRQINLKRITQNHSAEKAATDLSRLWDERVESKHLPESTRLRLKNAFFELAGSQHDLEWCHTEHMRLLTPSKPEREKLLNEWRQWNGRQSLQEMIQRLIPNQVFADPEEAAEEFFIQQLQKLNELHWVIARKDVDNQTSSVKEAADIVKRLSDHLAFSRKENLTFDRSLFSKAYFKEQESLGSLFDQLLKLLEKQKIEASDSESQALIEAEKTLHLVLIDEMPFSERCNCAALTERQLADWHHVNADPLEYLGQHIPNLKVKLGESIRLDLLKCFQAKDLQADWVSLAGRSSRLSHLLFSHVDWLPQTDKSREDTLDAIRQSGLLSGRNAQFFIGHLSHYFDLLQRLIRQGKPNESRQVENLIGNRDYFQAKWSAAMSLQRSSASVQALLKKREEVREMIESSSPLIDQAETADSSSTSLQTSGPFKLTVEDFDDIFPSPAEVTDEPRV